MVEVLDWVNCVVTPTHDHALTRRYHGPKLETRVPWPPVAVGASPPGINVLASRIVGTGDERGLVDISQVSHAETAWLNQGGCPLRRVASLSAPRLRVDVLRWPLNYHGSSSRDQSDEDGWKIKPTDHGLSAPRLITGTCGAPVP